MARIEFDARVALDVDLIARHWLLHDAPAVQERIDEIIEACSVLERHPLIGRRVEMGLRELVIGHGSRAYVALYDHQAEADLVLVVALKAQREAGYSR